MSTSEPIRITRHGDHVAVLTIDRFERRNAFDVDTALALEAAIDAYDADPDLYVAVLTRAGGVFSAGQDLIAAQEGKWAIAPRRGGFGIFEVGPVKPIIAAVEGYALAGGLELALSCDLIVAAENVMMGLPEARWSLLASGGGLIRLPKRIPYHVAMELALTAASRPASYFHQLGLVNRLAAEGGALDEALRLADEILACGPIGVAAAAAVVRRTYDWSEAEAWEQQKPLVARVLASRDHEEGLRAFAEKRSPVWTNT
jgi:enoyl-CoA hydratase